MQPAARETLQEAVQDCLAAARKVLSALPMKEWEIARKANHSLPDLAVLFGELDWLTSRLADKKIYLGVIGGSCSGKSTLLNSLSGTSCLPEDDLPGATHFPVSLAAGKNMLALQPEKAAPMPSPWHDNDLFAVLGRPGHGLIMERNPFSFFGDLHGEGGEKIRHAVLTAPGLPENVVFTDTPGLDYLNPRHGLLAREAAKYCDALLVAAPLHAPLGQSLLSALGEIAGPQARNCLFAGTFADRFQAPQLDRLAYYLQKKIISIYKGSHPLYFFGKGRGLMEIGSERGTVGGWAMLVGRLNPSKIYFRAVLAHRSLSAFYSAVSAAFDSRHWDASAPPAIPTDYWQNAKKILCRALAEAARKHRRQAAKKFLKELEELENGILFEIDSYDDVKELRNFIKYDLEIFFNDSAAKFQAHMQATLGNFILAETKKLISGFERDCAGLAAQTGDGIHWQGGGGQASHAAAAWVNLKQPERIADVAAASENIKLGGGVAAGLAAAMLIPGVGLISGGLLLCFGCLAGLGLFESLKKEKKKYSTQIKENFLQIRAGLPELVEKCQGCFLHKGRCAIELAVEDCKNLYIQKYNVPQKPGAGNAPGGIPPVNLARLRSSLDRLARAINNANPFDQ